MATNFENTAHRLVETFEETSAHEISIVTGATGQLFAQITYGAPVDLFLAADAERPTRLAEDGLGLTGTQTSYALGRLVLWSAGEQPETISARDILQAGRFRRLAIANPDLAPYGEASIRILDKYLSGNAAGRKIVRGQNVGQAFAMVASGNAEFGFAAWSQIKSVSPDKIGWYQLFEDDDHAPIRQDMILLARGADNLAAKAFYDFMSSDVARAIISGAGYDLP